MFGSTTAVHRCHLVSAFFNCDTCWRQDPLPFATSSPSSGFVSLAQSPSRPSMLPTADGRLKTGAHSSKKKSTSVSTVDAFETNQYAEQKKRNIQQWPKNIKAIQNTHKSHKTLLFLIRPFHSVLRLFTASRSHAHSRSRRSFACSRCCVLISFFFCCWPSVKVWISFVCMQFTAINYASVDECCSMRCFFPSSSFHSRFQFQSNPFKTDYHFLFLSSLSFCEFGRIWLLFLWNWRSFNRNRDDHCIRYLEEEARRWAGVCRSRNRQKYVTSWHS